MLRWGVRTTRKWPMAKGRFSMGEGRVARCLALLLAAPLVCGFAGGCAALTNPVADGVPVRHLPEELLDPTKADEETIPLTTLGQPRPPAYRLEPGDVSGVYGA